MDDKDLLGDREGASNAGSTRQPRRTPPGMCTFSETSREEEAARSDNRGGCGTDTIRSESRTSSVSVKSELAAGMGLRMIRGGSERKQGRRMRVDGSCCYD